MSYRRSFPRISIGTVRVAGTCFEAAERAGVTAPFFAEGSLLTRAFFSSVRKDFLALRL